MFFSELSKYCKFDFIVYDSKFLNEYPNSKCWRVFSKDKVIIGVEILKLYVAEKIENVYQSEEE